LALIALLPLSSTTAAPLTGSIDFQVDAAHTGNLENSKFAGRLWTVIQHRARSSLSTRHNDQKKFVIARRPCAAAIQNAARKSHAQPPNTLDRR
jgi:hypothetical protein